MAARKRSQNRRAHIRGMALCLLLPLTLLAGTQTGKTAPPDARDAETPLVRAVDLDVDESQEVRLADGSKVRVKLLSVAETRDKLCNALRQARVKVEVDGTPVTLASATYHLPVTVGGVQIDCPVTRGYTANSSKRNVWGLEKAARLRLWPGGSPWIRPGTFTYPVRQRWFASDTQMANEPVFVDGGEIPGKTNIYYHYGLDFGGAEGMVEVVAATDGLVVTAAGETMAGQPDSPAKPRYDLIYVVDGRGWYYRYSHLMRIDVKPGQRVRMGQQIGLLGKEGGSGGWSHLHFDVTSRQPSGQWGIQDAYTYVWEAYRNEYAPAIVAVARPHHFAAVGQRVVLDGSKSWSSAGKIARYQWIFAKGVTAVGPLVERTYDCPGAYSHALKVTDAKGREAWDFAVVQVADPDEPESRPPTIHPVYYPTTGIRPGDPVTFKVRSFRTTDGNEVWDFGDGSPPVKVKSDGNANVHAKDGYAVTQHRYAKAGRYLVHVERVNRRGEKAVRHLHVGVEAPLEPQTQVSLRNGKWHLNGRITYAGTPAEGLLMNVRMVNAVFEDRYKPEFDAEANTRRFLAQIPDYAAHGVRAFTIGLQGGMPGYEGALNSAFTADGTLRESYLKRVRRVIEACDRQGIVVILGCYYQRQDQVLADEKAVRRGLVNAVNWIGRCGFRNVVLEIANEFDHGGFNHRVIRTVPGQIELIRLVKRQAPDLLVSVSGLGHGRFPDELARVADFLLIHFNGTKLEDIPARIAALKKHGRPIVCNEDDKVGQAAARAAELCVADGASYGLMLKKVNQYFPLEFHGAADDAVVYRKLKQLTSPRGSGSR